jgi:anti-sigma B factor antagonist
MSAGPADPIWGDTIAQAPGPRRPQTSPPPADRHGHAGLSAGDLPDVAAARTQARCVPRAALPALLRPKMGRGAPRATRRNRSRPSRTGLSITRPAARTLRPPPARTQRRLRGMGHVVLEVTRRGRATLSVLVVRGAIDVARCYRLSSAINEALVTARARLVIDLRRVDFVDSIGLAVLVQARRRRALRRGVELEPVCEVPSTLKVPAVTTLARSFDIPPTTESALPASSPPP